MKLTIEELELLLDYYEIQKKLFNQKVGDYSGLDKQSGFYAHDKEVHDLQFMQESLRCDKRIWKIKRNLRKQN